LGDSFFSGRSIGTNGGGLAARISNALSKIVQKNNSSLFNVSTNEEDEISEILSLAEELNKCPDLTNKLNSHSKIIKFLDTNEELNNYPVTFLDSPTI
jgi:hypothetical protein